MLIKLLVCSVEDNISDERLKFKKSGGAGCSAQSEHSSRQQTAENRKLGGRFHGQVANWPQMHIVQETTIPNQANQTLKLGRPQSQTRQTTIPN